jgi:hypothetical protein
MSIFVTMYFQDQLQLASIQFSGWSVRTATNHVMTEVEAATIRLR